MAHYYVVRQKLDKTGAEDKVRYYGVPVTCGRVSTKKLADLVADRCSLSRGDVFASVCEIGGMILELLKDGYSVELDGLGDFYLSTNFLRKKKLSVIKIQIHFNRSYIFITLQIRIKSYKISNSNSSE